MVLRCLVLWICQDVCLMYVPGLRSRVQTYPQSTRPVIELNEQQRKVCTVDASRSVWRRSVRSCTHTLYTVYSQNVILYITCRVICSQAVHSHTDSVTYLLHCLPMTTCGSPLHYELLGQLSRPPQLSEHVWLTSETILSFFLFTVLCDCGVVN